MKQRGKLRYFVFGLHALLWLEAVGGKSLGGLKLRSMLQVSVERVYVMGGEERSSVLALLVAEDILT